MRPAASRVDYRQVLIVLVVAWLARFLFVWFMPPRAASTDIRSWYTVGGLLWDGVNPYKETSSLNWPPLWMQIIYFLSKMAALFGKPLRYAIQIFLTVAESAVIVALFRLIRQILPDTRPFLVILLGIALNPATIFLTCQHGNFDVLAGLWVLLFASQLIQYHQTQKEVDWLAACMFLGLGILTKTVPLVLCPMLAGGLRHVRAKARILGLVSLLGPVTLGMSIIYVLAPDDVTRKVLAYRSISGFFGISGLLQMTGADAFLSTTKALFYVLLATAAGAAGMFFWKRQRVEPRDIILFASMLLVLIPCLGPGYSPSYLYWFLPLLIPSYFLGGKAWQRALAVFAVVVALTYIVEYAVIPSHGKFLSYIFIDHNITVSPETLEKIKWMGTPAGQFAVRLPLFAAYLTLLLFGMAMLARGPQAVPAEPPPAKSTPTKRKH